MFNVVLITYRLKQAINISHAFKSQTIACETSWIANYLQKYIFIHVTYKFKK